MTDSPHRGRDEQPDFRDGPSPTQPLSGGYQGYPDPAYASQAPYGPTYQNPAAPPPTEQMPYGYDPYAASQFGGQYPPEGPGEPPEDEPKSPRWLWVLATTAVLAVIGLVIALVVVYDTSSRQETVVAPPPSLSEPSSPTRSPTTTSRTPSTPVLPLPTLPSAPPTTGTTAAGPTETVVYNVTGDGRAINITYVDNGGMLQTEFNVLLPWSKEVQLPEPANSSASISIINVGREVNCSISVNGVTLEQRSGAGLTICATTG
ncbi:MmpS family transport accessory protein [Mycolicibacterium tusciae]|uniref:MmpS family transport accessory protein n=1 Tax=Mycolicibacterium tusciae TaxID=75922 RepID=UPI00024A1DED|nr:MmpS family transport accessory protein [Mycolicibacterium tusciae]